MRSSSQNASPLLALPAELRNLIYTFILRQPSNLPFECVADHSLRDDASSVKPARRRFCSRILLTCKQINAEATPILYGQNIFCAHPSLLANLPSMVLTTRPSRIHSPPIVWPDAIRMIKRFYLRVRLDIDLQYDAKQVEASFAGVEELEIDVFQAMFDSCTFAALAPFEGLRGIGRAIVRGSVGDGRYAAWLAETMMLPHGTSSEWTETFEREVWQLNR